MECGKGDDEYAPGGQQTELDKVNTQKKEQAIQIGERLRRCTKTKVASAVRDGEIVGIATLKLGGLFNPAEGLGFAIPSRIIREELFS